MKLADDDEPIVTAADVAAYMNAERLSLRDAAPHFECSFNSLFRLLTRNGYQKQWMWVKRASTVEGDPQK